MIFSQKQIFKIMEIIDKNQAIFIGSKLGLKYLSPFQKSILKRYGVDLDEFEGNISEIEKAFYFGMLAQKLGGLKSFNLTNKNFEKWFEEKLNQPKNKTRNEAIDFIKKRSFADLSGLGNRIQGKLSNRILTAPLTKRKKIEKQIKETSQKGLEKNWTSQQLASELRNLTEEWARDFSRIADFVLQEAYGFGRAQQILEDYGEDAEVYKQTFPGVCKPCEENYGSPGEKPVIYKLEDLLANGNNIGRKNQLPVVGNAHPWARSILHVVPPDSEWDESKKKFVLKRNKRGVKRDSKVKVNITN